MQESCRNIYRDARRTAGLTQERWAEVLGISVEAVRLYETGQNMPGDEIALRMAEVAGQQIICYWHLLRKSRVAAETLPPVERLPLAQAVVQLLARIREFNGKHSDDALLRIAEDGRVDADELLQFREIVRDLHGIVQAALQIDYAEKEAPL